MGGANGGGGAVTPMPLALTHAAPTHQKSWRRQWSLSGILHIFISPLNGSRTIIKKCTKHRRERDADAQIRKSGTHLEFDFLLMTTAYSQ